jgi:hypothetical protein
MLRQRQQTRLFLGQGLAHKAVALVADSGRVCAMSRIQRASDLETVERAESPGGEEGVAEVLDHPLRVASVGGTGMLLVR